MSGPLNPTVQEGQLASDWAKDTGSALGVNDHNVKHTSIPVGTSGGVLGPHDSAVDTTAKSQDSVKNVQQSGSNVSTPGLNVPGSWNGAPTAGAERLYNDVGNALTTAVQTAGNYLPASVTSAFTGTQQEPSKEVDKSRETQAVYESQTLPSQDVEGQQPLQGPMGGAGALPGGKDEVNVAVLPDDKDANAKADPGVPTQHGVEPSTSAPTKTAYSATAVLSSAVNAASSASQVAAQKATEAYEAFGSPTATSASQTNPKDQQYTRPSQDHKGQTPHMSTGGVGALPGKATEEGVAILPEERVNPDPIRSAGVNKNTELAAPYHPDSGPKIGTVDPPSQSLSAKAKDGITGKDTHPSDSTSRTSLMDKVKGQAKIVSGKITSDAEKVEAGKAQKSGVHM